MQSLSGQGRGVSQAEFLGTLQCLCRGVGRLFLPRLHSCHGSRRAFQTSVLLSTKNMDGKRQSGGGGACSRTTGKGSSSNSGLSPGRGQRGGPSVRTFQEDPFGMCREVQVSGLLPQGLRIPLALIWGFHVTLIEVEHLSLLVVYVQAWTSRTEGPR